MRLPCTAHLGTYVIGIGHISSTCIVAVLVDDWCFHLSILQMHHTTLSVFPRGIIVPSPQLLTLYFV